MIETLTLSILTGLAILGYHKASQPDFILYHFHNAIIAISESDKWQKWILTPIFLCPYCMASFWTGIVHLLFAESFIWHHVLIGIFATCGMVTLKPE